MAEAINLFQTMITLQNIPRISVVVPSYNQVQYLEETLCSILDQNYPGLELIVIDGGSTDGSLEILQKYADRIVYWVSEPDRGQSHAINKGLAKATGEWVAWMNSDDCYLPDTLVRFFNETNHEHFDFMHGLCSSGSSMQQRYFRTMGRNTKKNAFAILRFFMGTEFIIPSQSVFIRRAILSKVGLLNEALHYVMDMDWFARIAIQVPAKRVYYYDYTICFYRKHALTKTSNANDRMRQEAGAVAMRLAVHLPGLQPKLLPLLVEGNHKFSKSFSQCRHLGHWMVILIKYPLHARYSIAFWAKLRQMLYKSAGIRINTQEDYKVKE